jgi:Met-zincin/Domain of unknown function (DUF5117)/Domain of unknown function (DUF5118)
MIFSVKKLSLAAVFSGISLLTVAQPKPVVPGVPGMPATLPTGASVPKPGPKPYKEVITDKAATKKGLLTVHKIEDKYFFEITDKMIGRDILYVNRVSKSSIQSAKGFYGYAGDQIGQGVIRFEKGPNQKIFLKSISYDVRSADSSQAMFRSVANSNMQPIAMAFDIKALVPDSLGGGSVIEITDNINGDNEIFGFSGGVKSAFQAGSLQADKSYISSVKPYPVNIEIKTVKTFGKSSGPSIPGFPPAPPSQATVTLELNSSLYLLPEKVMKPRYTDPRVDYFSREYTDFDANPQGVKEISMITRWKLEPKPEDMERYKRGELVEPAKPIVYYIDPATPKKWVPYLIAGVNDWNVAFEKAGFKNAIAGKVAPTKAEDSTWSLEDARFSAIVYKPSDVENAYGPNVHDPRSGEIIESHIGWFHNVMHLLRNWYLIQTAAVDPRSRKMDFDDDLMGELIRFVSSHEVGHTLGLPHNFGSSSSTPVENLRNKAWVEANGHTPSIMDYARFNYVAQPEDNISPAGLYTRIGEYDKWAIEWGYKFLPDAKTAEDEVPVLDKWVAAKASDKRYWFGRQGQPDDPRCQSEDIGDNAMKASTYGIKNLQRILPNLPAWTKTPNEAFQNLSELYGEVVGQFRRYIGHVCYNFGGIYETPKKVDQGGPVYEYVSKATQKEAMEFIKTQVFNTPTWLINKDVKEKTGLVPNVTILAVQETALGRMLSTYVMGKMLNAEAANGNLAYTVTDLLGDLKQNIFTELATKKPVDIYRRNLQKAYIERLGALVNPPATPLGGFTIIFGGGGTPAVDSKKSDLLSVLKGHARELKQLADAAAITPDKMTKYHLQDISDRLNRMLNPK